MKKLVLDFDGTLLDSRARHTALLRDLCVQDRLSVPVDDFAGYLPFKTNGGSTFRYLTERAGYAEDIAKQVSRQWVERIETPAYLAMDALYPDTMAFLRELCAAGTVELILVSARQNRELLTEQLRKFQIDGFFANVFCVFPQHAADEKSTVLARLDDVVISIGDTEVDCLAAARNGIPFYALNRGFRSAAYWERQGVASYSEFPMINEMLSY